jgi:protein TonB
MLACTVVYFWPREAQPTDRAFNFPGEPGVFPSPPPIAPEGGGAPGMPSITPDIADAIIEPVDDETLKNPDVLPETGESESEGPITDLAPAGGYPPLVVPPASPGPDDFVPFDDEPVLISYEPPVYPAIVREAGIDGTVHVRVLVGVNGKVKNAYVVDGPAALRDAALASARTAIFKPALQGVHPVEAWVVMPITFRLHEGH